MSRRSAVIKAVCLRAKHRPSGHPFTEKYLLIVTLLSLRSAELYDPTLRNGGRF